MFETICSIISLYTDFPKENITLQTHFLTDLALGSLEIMTMIGQVEDEFDVQMDLERLRQIFTISDLILYIQELQTSADSKEV